MRKNALICLSVLLFVSTAAWSQPSNPSIIPVVSAPSGSCPAGLPDQQLISSGLIYSCQSVVAGTGTWALAAGSVSGTIGSGGPYNLAAYPGGTTTTVGPINLKTDSTGNNLYHPGFDDVTALGSAPAGGGAGHFRAFGITTQGFTRLNILNELGGQPTVLGRDNQFIVQNSLGSPINAGAVVYINGSSSSNIPTVALAEANSLSTAPAIGIVYSTIGPGGYGYVMHTGILSGVNTVALGGAAGQSYFLSCTSPGGLTTTRPTPPCYAQKIGTSLYSSVVSGAIWISIQTSLGNHDSGTDQTNFAIPNGGVNGLPLMLFGASNQNISIGLYSLPNSASDTKSIALGVAALQQATGVADSIAIGYAALNASKVGAQNIAIGSGALASSTDNYSTAVGYFALNSDTTGPSNDAFGNNSLFSLTTGNNNAAYGEDSLSDLTVGTYNTCVGLNCAMTISDGVTPNTNPNYGVFLGFNTEPLADGDTNEIIVGANAIGHGSNTSTIGNTSTTGTYIFGIKLPGVIFSHAGTQLSSCSSSLKGGIAVVSDSTSLTPGTAYSPGAGAGGKTTNVQCTFDGTSTYAWQTM